MKKRLIFSAILLFVPLIASRGEPKPAPRSTFELDSTVGLELHEVTAEAVTYRGRRAVHLGDLPHDPSASLAAGGYPIAILPDSGLGNGTIEVALAGAPRAGAPDSARGFIGIAFRVQGHGSPFECFYLRMTNGRADDQLRRNHAAQYISEPGFPWERLRQENPGVYESYVDLEPGVWTAVRIVVSGRQARLYVNGARQPSLIVRDLKQGESSGRIGLWIGDNTDGYFSRLTVKREEPLR